MAEQKRDIKRASGAPDYSRLYSILVNSKDPSYNKNGIYPKPGLKVADMRKRLQKSESSLRWGR